MPTEQISLWRWAKPSTTFKPKENPYWTDRHVTFSSHNNVVYAGLNPLDWMWMKGEDCVLHKIVLTKKQAELCVVAEADFRPTDKETID